MAIEQLQRAVDELAERLGRSVVIDDATVRLVVASRHFGDEDEVRVRGVLQREAGRKALGHVLAQGVTHWTTAGVIPPLPEIGMKARVCVPIRWRAELLGLLMVMDADSTLTTAELTEITAAAADMAPYLKSMVEEDGSGGEEAVWDLISSSALSRRQALSDLEERHDPTRFSPMVALHLTADVPRAAASHAAIALTSGLRVQARDEPAAFLYAAHDSTAVVLLGLGGSGARQQIMRRATRMVGRINDLSAQRFDWVCGIGTVVEGLDLAVDTADQARLAASAAPGLLPGPVVLWDELGAYASLLRIPPSGRTPHALPSELRRLIEVDSDGQLTKTVRAYLDHGGSSPEAADALHIHRTTLYYRLGRVQELADLDLADGRTRLALHVGLELMSIANAGQRP
ncbi:PucR family transcriptional regulator [Nocardioides pocheonensis]|uniref:PucR family transcriptional regulator n=1 Tax=Nocardioides pocheonensis TaxID=661485 RepID=A0A3N0GHT3_9ACTN|nr:helix-turn-helix domain-containing protein [Nocardioides pocheonensis]RNM12043.1 PucR family transcriptional regulator [Nocardioides pocheonensis]